MAGASIAISVDSTAPELSARIRRAATKHLPFATAKSLTRLAQGGRDEQRSQMSSRFKIRNKRVERGITIQRAEKKDWPKPFSLVGTRDPFIARHEGGGPQRPVRTSPGTGLARFAVPTRVVKSKRTGKGAIPKPLTPRRLLQRGQAFLTDEGEIVLKRRRAKTFGNLGVLFTLHRTIRLKKALKLRPTVEDVARAQYGAIFAREIKKALEKGR